MRAYISGQREGYYLAIDIEQDFYCYDEEIAELIGIELEEYQDILKRKYNAGIINGNETYFNNERNAEKALEWLERTLIVCRLRGVI